MNFVFDLVVEEQTPQDSTPGIAAATVDPVAYPGLALTALHLARDFDDRFTHGIDLILTGRSAAWESAE